MTSRRANNNIQIRVSESDKVRLNAACTLASGSSGSLSGWLVKTGLEAAAALEARNARLSVTYGLANPLAARDVLPEIIAWAVAARVSDINCALTIGREPSVDITFQSKGKWWLHRTVSGAEAVRLIASVEDLVPVGPRPIPVVGTAKFDSDGIIMQAYSMQATNSLNVLLRVTYPFARDDSAEPSFLDKGLQDDGFVVFCGPSGSGKTRSAYTLISHLATNASGNIATIEDPVEYNLADLRIPQYDRQVVDAHRIARSNYRRILLGCIYTEDDAKLAFNLNAMGIQVVTSMHGLNATQVVDRLRCLLRVDFLPFKLTLVHTRLAMKLCEGCRVGAKPPFDEGYEAGIGCADCGDSPGYRGFYPLYAVERNIELSQSTKKLGGETPMMTVAAHKARQAGIIARGDYFADA